MPDSAESAALDCKDVGVYRVTLSSVRGAPYEVEISGPQGGVSSATHATRPAARGAFAQVVDLLERLPASEPLEPATATLTASIGKLKRSAPVVHVHFHGATDPKTVKAAVKSAKKVHK